MKRLRLPENVESDNFGLTFSPHLIANTNKVKCVIILSAIYSPVISGLRKLFCLAQW